MKSAFVILVLLVAASIACTLSPLDGEDDGPRTPTAIRISDAEATATRITRSTQRPRIDATGTPSEDDPSVTGLPTLFPTPVQFSTPSARATPTPLQSGGSSSGGGSTTGSGQAGVVVQDAASGAPQSNGFYFPNRIVYINSGVVRAIGRDGSNDQRITTANNATRQLNGLYVATGDSALYRPDGQRVATGLSHSTLTAWTQDSNVGYWGRGSALVRYDNGTTNEVDHVNGELIKVQFSPDGSMLMYASRNHIKLQYNDGSRRNLWEDANSQVTRGPFLATYNGSLGVYVELSDNRRAFLGEGFSEITNPNIQLQLRSPANNEGRVYLKGGTTPTAVWPGVPERPLRANSLQDVSWSPNSAHLVYTSTSGELVVVDVTTGSEQVIASGNVSSPMWTPPHYFVDYV